MRRTVVACAVLASVIVAVPAVVAKPRAHARFAEGTYDAPAAGEVAGCSQTDAIGCVALSGEPGERLFKAKVRDSHGLSVYVEVVTGDGGEAVAAFCGETPARVAFPESAELRFLVGAPAPEGVPCGAGGMATNGTISVTFLAR